MDRATLAGTRGVGELKVIRSASDNVEEISGVWRLDDEGAGDLSPIRQLKESGERTSYRGPIVDPLYPDVHEVELEVIIRGVEAYTYDHGDGQTRELVKITGVGPLGYEGTARRVKEIDRSVIDEITAESAEEGE
jgi:hypothetical protein